MLANAVNRDTIGEMDLSELVVLCSILSVLAEAHRSAVQKFGEKFAKSPAFTQTLGIG